MSEELYFSHFGRVQIQIVVVIITMSTIIRDEELYNMLTAMDQNTNAHSLNSEDTYAVLL